MAKNNLETEAAAVAGAGDGAEKTADRDALVEDKVNRMLGETRSRRSLTVSQITGIDFWLVYGVIVGVILIVIGGILGYLWRNLALYEKSSPDKLLAQYLRPLVTGGLPRLLITEASKPAKYEASTDKDAYIRELLGSGELLYKRAADESDHEHDVYLFKAGEVTIAAVTLVKRPAGRFGFWDPLKIDIRMPEYGDLRVITPVDAVVHVNGIELFEEDIHRDQVEYKDMPRIPEDKAESVIRREYKLLGLYRPPLLEAWLIKGDSLESEPLDIIWTNDENGPIAIIIPPQPESADDIAGEAEDGAAPGAGAGDVAAAASGEVSGAASSATPPVK